MARRADDDRRQRDRRSAARDIATDRRAGRERRLADRRASSDRRSPAGRRRGRRRRETPTPYTAEQVAELRARFVAPGPVTCPACEGRFSFGPGRRRGAEVARRVVCLGCGRGAVVPHSRAARVLIVDQHPALRDTLSAILASAGHDVIEADDATVALAAFQAAPADVVIIDVLASGRMQAPEFLRRLRRGFPDARVVAMAGRPSYQGVDPLAVTQGLGAARTLRMPISKEDLLRVVDEVRQ
jgi:CheY-like chemotaxis protein